MSRTPATSEEATLVVSRRIKPGREKEYSDWLRRVIEAASAFPGYRGVTTLAPQGFDSDTRYMIWRFDNQKDLDNWERSDVRNKFVAEVQNYAEQHYERATGMETWFSLPDMHRVVAPPRWKMFLVTTLAAYLVSMIARTSLTPYLGSWPFYVTNLIFSAILVGVLTYLFMPWLSRLLRRWLYSSQASA
jgi:antibiotic biosynthesis monooxygenase (ABM) superfamily enzyme